MLTHRKNDEGWLAKWMLAALLAMTLQSAYARADISESNAIDYLRVERSKAAIMVQQLKTEFLPGSPEYTIARQKYAAAQQAFNNYTTALVGNYAAGTRADLSASAQLAYSKASEFEAYISNLHFAHKGFTAVFVAAGVLIDIGDKLYTLYTKQKKEEREARAKQLSLDLTWSDWDEI